MPATATSTVRSRGSRRVSPTPEEDTGRGDTYAIAYPERIVPAESPDGIVAIHERRYRFALRYCAGKDVLDAACGVGYGSAILAEQASSVVGVDISADAIAYAGAHYARPNCEFRIGDLRELELPDKSFDTVCAFETIEHLADRDRYLAEVVRVLRPGGTYLVSTPQVPVTTATPENPFHEVEFSRDDFETLLRSSFGDVEMYGQRRHETRRHRLLRRLDVLGLRRRSSALRRLAKRATATAPTESLVLDDVVIDDVAIESAPVLVAVCRRPRTR